MYKQGVVVGKFYPPHRGHKYLIDTASTNTEELNIILCWRPGEKPEGYRREQWLKEIHPTANVLAIEDVYPDDDSKLWAELTIGWLGYAPDVVFTSEDYGYAYAGFLGCEHVQVDKARLIVPISGTAVRSNPLAKWDFLEPPVRAYYAKRVCVIGAESTGTTTLAQALANHYRTVWVAEYGREYSEIKMDRGDNDWSSAEFVHIAEEQSRREDVAARSANKVLICDTDAFATSIWHLRYMGSRSSEVEVIAAPRRYDLYLLTDVDIPFVQDGYRDGENIRLWMHGVFLEELAKSDKSFALLSGSHEARLAKAISLIDPLLKS
jgi:HTH-type transcriptional regulator, transcriptional repressor of NAD biosynthesis genes